MSAQPVPDNFHTVTPYLVVRGVDKLLEFVETVFDAEVMERHARPDGVVLHARVRIGDSMVMMGDPTGAEQEWQKPLPTALYLYVPDCDKLFHAAIAAGAKALEEPADMFYGDRHGGVVDPWGNQWWIATHKEDISPEELERRAALHMES